MADFMILKALKEKHNVDLYILDSDGRKIKTI